MLLAANSRISLSRSLLARQKRLIGAASTGTTFMTPVVHTTPHANSFIKVETNTKAFLRL